MDCQLQFGVLSPGVKADSRWHFELGSQGGLLTEEQKKS